MAKFWFKSALLTFISIAWVIYLLQPRQNTPQTLPPIESLQASSTPQITPKIAQIAAEFLDGGNPLIDRFVLIGNQKQQLNLSLAAKIMPKPETIILGTSHVQYLCANLTNSGVVFNHFVPAGTLNVFEQTYDFYKNNNKLPQKVILELDIGYLNRKFSPLYMPQLSREQNIKLNTNIVKRMGRERITQFQTTIRENISNLIAPLNRLTNRATQITASKFSHAGEEVNNQMPIRRFLQKDGTAVPCLQRPNCAPLTDAGVRVIMFETHLWFVTALEDKPPTEFQRFIHKIRSDNVAVAFVLPPIHPVAYESLTDDPIPELAYNYFASFAKENNIPMLGSYNPAQCHLEKQDFEDDDHITMQGMIKLFKGIYCKQGEWSQFVE